MGSVPVSCGFGIRYANADLSESVVLCGLGAGVV